MKNEINQKTLLMVLLTVVVSITAISLSSVAATSGPTTSQTTSVITSLPDTNSSQVSAILANHPVVYWKGANVSMLIDASVSNSQGVTATVTLPDGTVQNMSMEANQTNPGSELLSFYAGPTSSSGQYTLFVHLSDSQGTSLSVAVTYIVLSQQASYPALSA
jgi:hypothetical protein